MRAFPRDFTALLGRAGHQVLEGRHPLCGTLATGKTRFVGAQGLLHPGRARAMARLLDQTLGEVLTPMEAPIPRSATTRMRVAYTERLPKTVRVRTAFLDHSGARARARAEDSGLLALLRSPSLHAFAQRLSGYPLRERWGLQALCYGPGDYAGPHNDHHPDEPLGKDGYTDLHLTFSLEGVEAQWLVYERGGHFSELHPLATVGGVTCYRLPIWHYTTPLVARPGLEARARRWVLLSTFLDRVAAPARRRQPASPQKPASVSGGRRRA
jgi:hypothetical protein